MRRKLRKPLAILLAFAMMFCLVPAMGFAADDADDGDNSVKRLSGQNRYETAANIAEDAFPDGAGAVVIANGEPALDYADALAGSFLAGAADAPILLTNAAQLPDATAKAIEKLGATKAYVLGGELAVSNAVVSQLEKLLEVERVEGQNRFETAVNISKVGKNLPGAEININTALIANGTRPADALAAGAYANAQGIPVLLVNQNNIPAATKAALAGIENTFVIGGNLVVSDDVASELDATRISGRTRNATSVDVAETLWESPENFALVNGADGIVDALAGSVLGMPILYVPSEDVDAYLDKVITGNSFGFILGGVNRISDEFLNEIQQKIEGVEEELQVVSVSAINANTISVTFEGMEPVEITLETPLVHGQTEVTFVYEEVEYTATLTEAYVDPAVVDAEAAKAVEDAIVALPAVDELTLEDAEAVAAARAAYDALTEAQKALVTNVDVLKAAEVKIAELEAAKADAEAAKAVEDAIAALPAVDELTLENAEAVADARAKYDTLTETQKALVTNVDVLKAAEVKIAELEAEAAEQAKAEAIQTAIDTINLIGNPAALTLEDEAKVVAARTAVDAALELGAVETDIVNYDHLIAAETQINALKEALNEKETAIQEANVALTNLPLEVTLEDKEEVETARTLVDDALALGAEENDFVNLWKLTDAEAKIAELEEEAAEAEAVQAVIEAIDALPEEITLEDAEAVADARAAYDALTEEQQELVTNVDVLEAAEAKIAELEEEAAKELKAAVEAKVVAFEELANGDLSTQELIDVAYTAKAEIDLEGLTEEDAADFQARIDAANEKVNAAQEALNEAKEYEEVLAGVEAKVAHFEELANEDLSTQELINEANVAKALINLEVGLTEEDAAAFQARIDAADALVVAAQGALDNLTAATKAVEAYEVAALTNADEVIAAEALAVTANEAVALVVDEVANAELLARIEVKDALVAEARTAEEAKAIALINNSTVFNIIQRLSAPILGLEDINPDFAAEYQQARLDNFTDTKEQIQKNVINFVNEAEQTAVNDLIEDLNQAINDYINAMNTTEQGQAVDDMETALTGLEAVIVPLTDYDALNNDEYMVAFAAMGTVNTFEEVQNVITQVNAEVQLETDVAAAQTLVEALFDDYDAKEALGADVDQEQIDAALTAVEALDDAAEEKAGLLADVQIAQDLLDAQNLAADVAAAQAAVEALFGTDAEGAVDKTALAETTDQEAIDEALVLINALDDAVTEKAGLLVDIQIAQVLLDIQDAQAAVEALFADYSTKAALAETADQEAIDEALVLVNALDDAVTEKAGLLVDIQDAQDLLDAADLLAAQAAVEALFGTDAEGAVDKTALAETADQEAIDEALVLVNALDDAVTEKVGLLVDIQDAQDLLDAADLLAAQEAVKALFADYSTKAALAETADQEAIDEALVLINALDDAVTEKAGLLVDIQDAQDLLDEQTELALVTAVNDATLVAGMETALTNLNYAPYINLGSAKRAEVAELFLAVEGETEFETQAAIELAIDSVISQYNTLIANVNNAGTIVELRAALQAVVDAGFTLTNLTNNPVQLTETEIVFDAMQSDDFTAFRTIADINGAAAGL
jgi:putative cell wall-binding protein